jgi:hypothetical protein
MKLLQLIVWITTFTLTQRLIVKAEELKILPRVNAGVIFMPESVPIIAGHATYHLFYRIPMPHHDIPTAHSQPPDIMCNIFRSAASARQPTHEEIDQRNRQLRTCRHLKTVADTMHLQMSRMMNEYYASRAIYLDYMKQARARHPAAKKEIRRSKRALLGFVGKASKWLFGTATEDEITKIKEFSTRVGQMSQANKDRMDSIVNALVHMQTINDHRYNLSRQVGQNTYEKVVEMLSAIRQININEGIVDFYINYLEKMVDSMVTHLLFTQDMDLLKRVVDPLIKAIILLTRGKVSPYLLPVETLKKDIDRATQRVITKHANYKLALTTHIDLMNNGLLTYYAEGSELVLVFALTFTTDQHTYNLYTTITMGVPVSQRRSELGYTKLEGLSDYIAVSRSGHKYALIDNLKLRQCQKMTYVICPFQLPTYTFPPKTCIAALFKEDSTAIDKYCKAQIFLKGQLDPESHYIGRREYIVRTNTRSYQLTCPSGIKKIKTTGYFTLTLQCACKADIESMVIDTADPECDTLSQKVVHRRKYPVNYMVIKELNLNYDNLTTSTTYERELKIDIPEMKEYVERHKTYSQLQEQQGMDARAFLADFKARDELTIDRIYDKLSSHFPYLANEGILAVTNIISMIAYTILALLVYAILNHLKLTPKQILALIIPSKCCKPVETARHRYDPAITAETVITSVELILSTGIVILLTLAGIALFTQIMQQFGQLGFRLPNPLYQLLNYFRPKKTTRTKLRLCWWTPKRNVMVTLVKLPFQLDEVRITEMPCLIHDSYNARTFDTVVRLQWTGDLKIALYKINLRLELPLSLRCYGRKRKVLNEIIADSHAKPRLFIVLQDSTRCLHLEDPTVIEREEPEGQSDNETLPVRQHEPNLTLEPTAPTNIEIRSE